MKERRALKGSEIITILNVIYRIITLPLIPQSWNSTSVVIVPYSCVYHNLSSPPFVSMSVEIITFLIMIYRIITLPLIP